MTLITRNIFDEFDLLFRNFSNSNSSFNTIVEHKLSHPVDVYEIDSGIQIDIAAVGLKTEDVKISVEDDILKVSYKKDDDKQCKSKKCVYKGINTRSFDLGWKINVKYDLSNIDAKLDKGLLSLKIPFKPESKPQRFEVNIK